MPTIPSLSLFLVTLPWNPNDAEEGDYASRVFATDDDEAIKAIATEMALHSDSGLDPEDADGIAEFVQDLVNAAGPYAAENISASLPSRLHSLMAGPTGEMSEQAQKDYQTVIALLAPYGVNP